MSSDTQPYDMGVLCTATYCDLLKINCNSSIVDCLALQSILNITTENHDTKLKWGFGAFTIILVIWVVYALLFLLLGTSCCRDRVNSATKEKLRIVANVIIFCSYLATFVLLVLFSFFSLFGTNQEFQDFNNFFLIPWGVGTTVVVNLFFFPSFLLTLLANKKVNLPAGIGHQ